MEYQNRRDLLSSPYFVKKNSCSRSSGKSVLYFEDEFDTIVHLFPHLLR